MKTFSGDVAGFAGEKAAFGCLGLLLAYSVVRNILAALAKPLWFDELITAAIASRPNLGAVWNGASEAKDANPPPFYIVERFFRGFSANEHIGYRLPSILGFALLLLCIFVFIKRRVGGGFALICVSTLLLTPFLRPYAVEARPYSLVAACLAFAMICYQHAPSARWMVLMGLTLALAECFHYYALFGFFPFGLAELAGSLREKRVRWNVWLAFAAGFVPLAGFWHLLNELRNFYGSHVWDPPSLFATAAAYALLFKTNAPIALGLIAALSALVLIASNSMMGSDSGQDGMSSVGERWLTFGFFVMPFIVFCVTKLMRGAYTDRYVLPALFGIPLSVAYLLRRLSRPGVALIAIFVLGSVIIQEAFFWQSAFHDVRNFPSPAGTIEGLVKRVGYGNLPVVISDALDYFQLQHYSMDARRFVSVVDPDMAVTYVKSDSVDRELPVLRCCAPLQIYTFQEFAAKHSSFLLYSGGGLFDWWPARLVNDGDSLELLASEQNHRVYLVNLKPRPAP